MEPLIIGLVILLLFSSFCLFVLNSRYRNLSEDLLIENSVITNKFKNLQHELDDLKKNPPKKEVYAIEAQQILHDMTANGQSIVRIIPISPSDVFWRSPN